MAKLKLGAYTVNLGDTLGSGSFGVVHSGQETKTGKQVAIKRIKIEKDEDGYTAMQEIKLFDRLPEHSNLIRLLDFHYSDRAFWMVMEFCEEGDLDVYVVKRNPGLDDKLRLMFECACAIAHMHSSSPPVVHRDIKPANVLMFRQSGGKIVAKVSDFGLSKMSESSAATCLYSTMAGTPAFLAPEIFEQKKYTASVDVFALGLLFLAMIQYKKGAAHLIPKLESGLGMMPVGMEMMTQNMMAGGLPQPKVVLIKDSDCTTLQHVKAVILKMAAQDPKARLSAVQVMHVMAEITGLDPAKQVAAVEVSDVAASNANPEVGEWGESMPNRLLEEALQEKLQVQKKSHEAAPSLSEETKDASGEGTELATLLHLLMKVLGGSGSTDEGKKFGVGEKVRVINDTSKAVRLQEDHGGWNSNMQKYLGKTGVVKQKLLNVVKVQFSDGQVWSYNPAMLDSCSGTTDQDDENTSQTFKRYDVVVIEKDESKAKKLQEGHGGWNPRMASSLGLKGIVNKVDGDGDVLVECINHSKWFFNEKMLTFVDTADMEIQDGDFVLVIDSHTKVKALQDSAHGGWNEGMRKTLGSAGIVSSVMTNGRAVVQIMGNKWIFNVKAIRLIARSEEMLQAVLQRD